MNQCPECKRPCLSEYGHAPDNVECIATQLRDLRLRVSYLELRVFDGHQGESPLDSQDPNHARGTE